MTSLDQCHRLYLFTTSASTSVHRSSRYPSFNVVRYTWDPFVVLPTYTRYGSFPAVWQVFLPGNQTTPSSSLPEINGFRQRSPSWPGWNVGHSSDPDLSSFVSCLYLYNLHRPEPEFSRLYDPLFHLLPLLSSLQVSHFIHFFVPFHRFVWMFSLTLPYS